MRIAVYLPKGHPEAGTNPDTGEPVEEPVGFAYRLGRIEEGVHNAPIGHAPVPFEQFVNDLLGQARSEYPDAEVRLETLIDNGDGTASWIAADDFDPDVHTRQLTGNIKGREVHVTTEQQTGADA